MLVCLRANVEGHTMPLNTTLSNACFMLLIKVTNFCTPRHTPGNFVLFVVNILLNLAVQSSSFALKEMTHQSRHHCHHASDQLFQLTDFVRKQVDFDVILLDSTTS